MACGILQSKKWSVMLGLHQRRGQAPSTGNFSDWFLINSPAISAAQNAHTQAIIFEVARLYTKGLTTRPTYSTFPSATICKNQSDDGQCARTKPPQFCFYFRTCWKCHVNPLLGSYSFTAHNHKQFEPECATILARIDR